MQLMKSKNHFSAEAESQCMGKNRYHVLYAHTWHLRCDKTTDEDRVGDRWWTLQPNSRVKHHTCGGGGGVDDNDDKSVPNLPPHNTILTKNQLTKIYTVYLIEHISGWAIHYIKIHYL